MTAINFPDSPDVDDQFTANGKTWQWDGTTWKSVGTVQGPSGPTGATGVVGPTGAAGATGPTGGFTSQQVVESKAENYTLTSSDAGKLLINSAGVTITVEGLNVGEQVDFLQTNIAQFTFVAGSSQTLSSKNSLVKTASTGSPATIKCVATDTYWLIGDLGV